MDGFYEQAYMQGQADMLMPYDVDSIEELVEKVKAEEESRIEPLIKEIREKVYQQGKDDLLGNAMLDNGELCWQECCSTERCGECTRLENGDIDYFDNTFSEEG